MFSVVFSCCFLLSFLFQLLLHLHVPIMQKHWPFSSTTYSLLLKGNNGGEQKRSPCEHAERQLGESDNKGAWLIKSAAWWPKL